MTTVSMTKRQVLLAICESPGWQPAEESSSIDRCLYELQQEGWICPRLDGFEATPRALDQYPTFVEQEDIRDLSMTPVVGEETLEPQPCVPLDRVTRLIVALLYEMPAAKVVAISQAKATQLPTDKFTWNLARDIADGMRR